ncbi:MAG: lipase [Deltaproteobacteria bacterium]|nr:lipase [Deltaproteobacteria bacterium]
MYLLVIIFLLVSCMSPKITDSNFDAVIELDSGEIEVIVEEPEMNIETFEEWLTEHSDYSTDLLRQDLLGGSFGGVESTQDSITHIPIIFVHGNSDRATGGDFGGWKKLREQFLEHGYTSAELYGTTYGSADPGDSSSYTHREEFVLQVRHHMEAVLAYTEAPKIHVISHSLGVTMARQAILGGEGFNDDGHRFTIGPSLRDKISVFIGIAGANQGLSQCYGSFMPICSVQNGLYPGSWNGLEVVGMSHFLQQLNTHMHYEGQKVYSIWGDSDEILGYRCLVWGMNSCQLPGQDGEASFEGLGHFELRDETFGIMYDWIVNSE